MKKTKMEKGITLIALIITIVVLLILAAVAINSITNYDTIRYVENTTKTYNNSVANEQTVLGGYQEFLNKYNEASIKPKVGQYVEYNVSYNDMYSSTIGATKTFGKNDGWRYLGTDTYGSHLLISTGVPMVLNYSSTADTNSTNWWDTIQTNASQQATQGMLKNLANIPYTKVSVETTSTSNTNTMIGLFGDSNRTIVGDYFKVTGKTYSNSITVRTLTLAELNRAVNSANVGKEGYINRVEDSIAEGFENLDGDALGLFDLSAIGLSNNYKYWLASPSTDFVYSTYRVCFISNDYEQVGHAYNISSGVRPVIVLPSNIQFTNVDNNSVLEIKE